MLLNKSKYFLASVCFFASTRRDHPSRQPFLPPPPPPPPLPPLGSDDGGGGGGGDFGFPFPSFTVLVEPLGCEGGGCPTNDSFCDYGLCRCRQGADARFGGCYRDFGRVFRER